jgi:hypothetical protein
MRWVLSIVAVVLLLMGTVWILQGLNILRQGFMAGQIQYSILGLIVDVVGLALLVGANRRRKPTDSNPTSTLKR